MFHLGLVVLLLAEVALVRARFQTDRFAGDARLWAALLLATRNAAPIGIASITALLLVAWKPLVREYGELVHVARSQPGSAACFAVHLLVFAGFYRLTDWTFSVFDGTGFAAFACCGAWCLGVLAVPLSAAAVAFPIRSLGASLVRLLPAILLAIGLGAGAFALSRFVLDSGLWFPLAVGTTKIARWLLATFAGESAVEPERFILTAGSFRVLVTSQCSGFEGVALTWTFLAAYLVWFRSRLRFPHVLVLVPLATLVVWLANAVRLAALVWIGDRFSPEVALQGFHSYAGWIVFCGLSLSVVYASQRVSWFTSEPRTDELRTVNPAAVYLGPFLGILAVSFLTGTFSAGFDAMYPLRVLVGALVLWFVRRDLPRARSWIHWTGLAFGVAGFVAFVGLERFGARPLDSRVVDGLAVLSPLMAAVWLGFRVLGFVLISPLAEELAFRGFLARRLVKADFESLSYRDITPWAWGVSSLAFGCLHQQWLGGTLSGAIFGLALMRRGRLGDAFVAHATTNALLLARASLLGSWHGWM